MTLKTVCDNALNQIGGISVPGTYIGNSDPTAERCVALLNASGRVFARQHKFQELRYEHTFTTNAAALQTNGLNTTEAFLKFANLTHWDRTNYWEVIGPLTAQQWQFLNSSSVQASPRRWFYIKQDGFYIFPTPVAGDTIAYEYYTSNWCESSGGTGQQTWQADGDVGRLDEFLLELDLKWRFLHALGESYGEAKQEALDHRDMVLGTQEGADVVDFQSPRGRFHFSTNLPDTGYGA